MTKNRKIVALKDDTPLFSKFAIGHILEIDAELTELYNWDDAVVAKNLTEPQRTTSTPAVVFFDEFEYLEDDDPDATEQILRREGL